MDQFGFVETVYDVTIDGRYNSFQYENGKFVEGEVDYNFKPMEELAEGRIDVWSKNST